MAIKYLMLFVFCYQIYGCGDYPAGYQDGYAKSEKKQWLVFGRKAYQQGFDAGLAEKFQQDWFAQNLSEMNILHCPEVIIRTDPLMFLPPEYKRSGNDTYQIVQ